MYQIDISNAIRGINSQMGVVRDKIEKAQNVKTLLKKTNNLFYASNITWENNYSSKMNSDITSTIIIEGEFRGQIADKLASTFPNELDIMNDINLKSKDTKSFIDSQLTKLDEYIDELNEKMASLRQELSNLLAMKTLR